MALAVAAAYLLTGFFLAGLYVGAMGRASLWDKASIILFWFPGIAYVVGYKIGRASRSENEHQEAGNAEQRG